jgi:spermidine synthase
MPLRLLSLLCFFFSGSTGLIYQVLWTRQLGSTIGNTHFSITVVVAVFMGGLALGSYLGGRAADRSPNPLRLYGLLVLAVGFLCLLVPLAVKLAQPLFAWLYSFREGEPEARPLLVARIAFSALVLLAPTTCMGATLPALSRYFTTRLSEVGFSVGRLYTVNTFGAFAGAVLTGFVLIQNLGLWGTMALAVSIDVAIGVLVLYASRVESRPSAVEVSARAAKERPQESLPRAEDMAAKLPWDIRLVVWAFFATGFANMLLQIAWTKAIVQTIGNSTYAFSLIVTLFIFGIGVGSLVMTLFVDRLRNVHLTLGVVVTLTALLVSATIPILGALPLAGARLFDGVAEPSYGKFLGIQLVLVSVVILPSTVVMGAVFPLVGKIRTLALERVGSSIGSAYFANTLGAILGTLAAGFLFVPLFGRIYRTLYLGAGLNLVTGLVLVAASLRLGALPRWKGLALRLGVAGALGTVIVLPHFPLRPHGEFGGTGHLWHPAVLSRGAYAYYKDSRYSEELKRRVDHFWQRLGEYAESIIQHDEVAWYREGIHAPVAVVTNPEKGLAMRISGKVEASLPAEGKENRDQPHQILAGHLPMLLHPSPRRVLTLGLGGGVTLGTLTLYEVENIDSLEISPEVIEAARLFFDKANRGALGERPLSPVRNVVGDGRNHILYTPRRYDVITSVPSNPWIAGIGNLFSVEFFSLCRERLAPGGIACNWIHKVNLRGEDLRTVVRTFIAAFGEHAQLWDLGYDCLLIGSNVPVRFDAARFSALLEGKHGALLREDLAALDIEDASSLLRHFQLGLAELRAFAGEGDSNTDDLPVLEFSCPKGLYGDPFAAYDALASTRHTPISRDWVVGLDEGVLERARNLQVTFHDCQMLEGRAKVFLQEYSRLGSDPDWLTKKRMLRQAQDIVLLVEKLAQTLARHGDPRLERRGLEVACKVLGVSAPSLSKALVAYFVKIADAAQNPGQQELRLSSLRKAWEYASGDLDVARRLAEAYLGAGKAAEALALLGPSLESRRDDAASLQTLGVLCAASGDLDKALPILERALDLAGNQAQLRAEIHGNLAFGFLQKKDLEAARTHYAEALELDPGNERVRKQLEALEAGTRR